MPRVILKPEAKVRVESVLNTPCTDTTNQKPLFDSINYQAHLSKATKKTKTVAPRGPPQGSYALSPRTDGVFGQANFAKLAGSTNSSNLSNVFTSTSPSSNPAGPSNLFGNIVTSHSPSEVTGSPSASKTGGTSSAQPFNFPNSNRTTSTPFGSSTFKGTHSLFTSYIDVTPSGKEVFQVSTALPAYQKTSLEVGAPSSCTGGDKC